MKRFDLKPALAATILLAAALAIGGCDSNPTNEPSQADIEKANADRAKAIDNDASLTPEGKAKMKEMMKLNGTSGPGNDKR
ncbi:MAG: hypothetical protein SFX74_10285 [Fimbriimonadaceae bacterium]|nr:hypothetical protein [Fimbriimonadaceae bacterium]